MVAVTHCPYCGQQWPRERDGLWHCSNSNCPARDFYVSTIVSAPPNAVILEKPKAEITAPVEKKRRR